MTLLTNPAHWLQQIQFIPTTSIGKANCEAGWDWHPAPLNDFDLWYALSGEGEMRINDEHYPIQKGSCFLIRPGDQPQATQDINHTLRVIFIHFQCQPQQVLAANINRLPARSTQLLETFYFETLLNRILELDSWNAEFRAAEFDLIIKQLIIILCREQQQQQQLSPLENKHRHLITQMISQLHDHSGSAMTNDQLAERAGMSPSYFKKIFKKVTGMPIKQYRVEQRLQRAKHLLQETSMNVSQVADALDYANVYYFSNQFKQHFGHPPSHFQAKGVAHRTHGKKTRK